jgi:hypothetical protein
VSGLQPARSHASIDARSLAIPAIPHRRADHPARRGAEHDPDLAALSAARY